MKASYNWLKELVGEKLNATPREIAAKLTFAGIEVESLHEYGAASLACIVARVVSTRPHPSKSGLKLVTIDRGGATQEVVCGAPNVPDAGGLVVLAPLGAHLPGKDGKGVTIGRRAIGGVESEGMLCSEAELGLTEDSAGILVLPAGAAEPGATLASAVPASHDTIFEIGLTPNRPDGLGHIGLAREIAALCEIPWKTPEIVRAKTDPTLGIDTLAKVDVHDFERCPHYGAAAIVDVAIAPSPLWARYRLAALGVRSISNLVDVTNLVMLEFGHPMHAFDLDRVQNTHINVRRATDGETMTTLDGVVRTLTADDLLICDGRGPVAIAGVMGGADSEIRAETKRVLFECAYFDPRGVRRTSRRLGLHTESSHRFERGVDPGDVKDVLARAIALTADLSPGSRAASGEIHAMTATPKKNEVSLRAEKLDALLGVHVPFGDACGILERLAFETVSKDAVRATFRVPTHRPDVSREADLIEEVVRIRGMDIVPALLPAIHPTREKGDREERVQRARRIAVELGLIETIPYAFCSRDLLARARAPEPSVILKNPLSELQAVMRTSVLPGVLDALANARRHGEKSARLFAIGPAFFARQNKGDLPEERMELAVAIGGERDAWLSKPAPIDVWDAKGIAVALVVRLTGRTPEIARTKDEARLHPRGAAELLLDGKRIGTFGMVHPDVCDALDLASDTACVEIALDADSVRAPSPPQCRPLPRFPASTRDLAVVVHDDILAGDVERAVREAAGALAEDVSMFDLFRGGAVPRDHASLAFRVIYRANDRTLTDIEVDQAHAKVVETVTARFGATLRA